VGRLSEARKVLTRAMKRGSSREHSALLKWLEQGAPADKDHPLPRPAPVHAIAVRGQEDDGGAAERREGMRARARRDDAPETEKRPLRTAPIAELEAVLTRGLASLPLDAKQRARARALARDAIAYFTRPVGSRGAAGGRAAVDAIAAAIAYAIVYVDHVPLTQAEVAACFRVSVASLRGRFGELRAHLDLLPGDVRYATLRRR
jgi:hypothetical protein